MRFGPSLAVAVALAAGSYTFADVGVLDKYECHDHQQTGEYHCHGPADLAKLGGFIVGADARVQGWSAGNGDLFLFAGIAANAEYNYKWMAVTGSYFYMPLVTDVESGTVNDAVVQQGWEAGVKLGPGVGRLGSKYYITAGWSSPQLDNEGATSDLSGYYAGVGFGANTNGLVFDVVATYRDATKAEEFLASEGTDTDVLSFDTRLSLGWRF